MRNILFLLIIILFTTNCKSKTTTKEAKYTNDLINETSPYLLDHAHNPVNWKAWNAETLAQAKKEDKLIVISIGYSACHWCHVMEEESFENDSVAKIMNDNFINIKVDREERPDIDKIYINAVQLMTGNAGWPLNCITLPDGRPVFGGTYFTKNEWMKVLKDMSSIYQNDPEKVTEYADKLTEGIKNSELITVNKEEPLFKSSQIKDFVTTWETQLDYNDGGLKGDIKFPMPNNLEFLLRQSYTNDNKKLQDYVNTALTKMAYGGIYDQLQGGFSRYSVDKKWHIPHFEKMLYDNAQLVSLYSNAYLATKDDLYKDVVTETLSFVEDELTDPSGAFYSSLDADSKNESDEREEGVYYVWTKDELQKILEDEYPLFKDYYNVNDFGKWENKNYVLIRNETDDDFAKKHNLTSAQLKSKVKQWRQTLLEVRSKRNAPKLDDKTLTSWNALMLKGYADAYRVFNKSKYLESAINNANFLMKHQIQSDGSLYRNYKNNQSTIEGYAEDYAAVIDAFITLYQVTLDEKWLKQSKSIADYLITNFKDDATNMFFFTSNKDEKLIARKMEVNDNVIPASNSMIAHSLFKLSHYYFDANYAKIATQMLNNVLPEIDKSPSAYSNWLLLLSNYTSPYYEVAISGEQAIEKLKELNTSYLANILVAGAKDDSTIPIMANRFNEGETLIYVCVDGTCKLPVTKVEEALTQLSN